MRHNFRLAVLADPGTFIHKIVSEFGTVTELGTEGWPADSEAVIFDCAHSEISRHRDSWCHVLDGRMSLGLIGMQTEDRAVLEGIVGRRLNQSIPSVFVRKFNGDPRGYRYTILPDVTSVQAMEPAEVAEFLTKRVFTVESQNPTVVGPPNPFDSLWPTSAQFGVLRGTRQEMVVNKAVGGSWGPPINSASNATLNARGHFLLANGEGGDGRYHVIILSRLSGVSPLAAQSEAAFGFGLRVTASVGGKLLQYPTVNVNATQPVTVNTPLPENWGYMGGFICTEFGGVDIKTQGTKAGSNIHTTCDVTPSFKEYRAQLTTPGIENFLVFQVDQPNVSEVQFTTWGTRVAPGNNETQTELVHVSAEGSEVQSELALGDEDFVVVHHLDLANPGLPSYNVDFLFTLTLYAVYIDGHLFSSPSQQVVTIDLVKATEMTTVD
jgi:hypothetical protein